MVCFRRKIVLMLEVYKNIHMWYTHTQRGGRENGKQVHTMDSVGLRDSEGAANTGWRFWSDIRGVGELPSQSQQGWGRTRESRWMAWSKGPRQQRYREPHYLWLLTFSYFFVSGILGDSAFHRNASTQCKRVRALTLHEGSQWWMSLGSVSWSSGEGFSEALGAMEGNKDIGQKAAMRWPWASPRTATLRYLAQCQLQRHWAQIWLLPALLRWPRGVPYRLYLWILLSIKTFNSTGMWVNKSVNCKNSMLWVFT